MKLLKPLFILMAIAALSSCKSATESETASLENFASGKNLHRNQCRAAPSNFAKRLPNAKKVNVRFYQKLSKTDETKLEKAVHDTLTALPTPLIKMFIAAGGEVVVTKDATRRCSILAKKFGLSPSGADVESCQFYGTMMDQSQRLSVVVPADESVIKHDLVKTLSYAISYRISRLRVDAKDKKFIVSDVQNHAVETAEKAMTRAFMLDVVSQGNEAMLKSLASRYFSIPDPEKLEEAIADSNVLDLVTGQPDLLKHFKFRKSSSFDSMRGWIFAHALDSAYCNNFAPYDRIKAATALKGEGSQVERDAALKNTTRVMADFFPITYDTFEIVEETIIQYAQWIAQANPPASSKSGEGFGLADTNTLERLKEINAADPGFIAQQGRELGFNGPTLIAGIQHQEEWRDQSTPFYWWSRKKHEEYDTVENHGRKVVSEFDKAEIARKKALTEEIDRYKDRETTLTDPDAWREKQLKIQHQNRDLNTAVAAQRGTRSASDSKVRLGGNAEGVGEVPLGWGIDGELSSRSQNGSYSGTSTYVGPAGVGYNGVMQDQTAGRMQDANIDGQRRVDQYNRLLDRGVAPDTIPFPYGAQEGQGDRAIWKPTMDASKPPAHQQLPPPKDMGQKSMAGQTSSYEPQQNFDSMATSQQFASNDMPRSMEVGGAIESPSQMQDSGTSFGLK